MKTLKFSKGCEHEAESAAPRVPLQMQPRARRSAGEGGRKGPPRPQKASPALARLQQVVLDDVTDDAVAVKVAAAPLGAKVLAEDHLDVFCGYEMGGCVGMKCASALEFTGALCGRG